VRTWRAVLHDKIITAVHSNDGQCEKCNPPPAYIESANGVTSDIPDVSTSSTVPDLPNAPASDSTSSDSTPTFSNTPSDVRYPLVDLTEESSPDDKRPSLDRRDSFGEDLMDVN